MLENIRSFAFWNTQNVRQGGGENGGNGPEEKKDMACQEKNALNSQPKDRVAARGALSLHHCHTYYLSQLLHNEVQEIFLTVIKT